MNENEAKLKAEMYCSAAERCRSEVAMKIRVWDKAGELDDAAAGRIIAHLEKEGYLDESRYAAAFVHDKLRFCRWGRVKIRMALRQKGIASDTLEEALDGIDEEEYMTILRDLIASRGRELRASSDYERSMKLLRFAAQRGFEPSLAGRIINIPED